MAQAFRLQPLLEVTDQRLDAAAAELQRLRARLDQERQRYDQLRGFDAEYAATLQEALRSGIEAHRLRDYRQFLDKLSRAIATQAVEVERCQHAWEEALRGWQDLKQRQQALEVLRARHLSAQAQREARIEQKLQDEFARHDRKRE
jgi:flagellar FliJ protein